MAKMEKLPFKEKRKRAERPLQVIHMDTMGPIKPTSYQGLKRFILVFVNDSSRFAMTYSVKSKDEADEALKRYLVSARNLLGKNEKIFYIRSDQGTEFRGGKFLEILRQKKIETELSLPYTPEHNGVAERFNRTIENILERFNMTDCKAQSTPMVTRHVHNRNKKKRIEDSEINNDLQVEEIKRVPYREVIGS